uniref:Uncharacterized protein n=1 Tax=Leptospirillum ferrodiazotrophum TaxID=412449 RepID=C6HZT6_9BACT|nr:MAG: conserved hypothetical protein 374 [Leptospirillum ferrodiazotrophum]
MTGKTRLVNLGAALGISGVALFFALRHVSLKSLGHILWKGHYGWLIPATFLLLAIYGVRALFWRQTLSVTRKVSYPPLYSSIVVGFMANSILPFRAGEMVRALYARRLENLPLPLLLSTILIERLFDLVSLSLLLFLYLVFGGQGVGGKSLWIIGGTAGLFLALVALVYGRLLVVRMLERTVVPLTRGHRLARKLVKTAEQALHGLSSITSPILLVRLFLTSLAIWGLTLILTWFTLITFDVTQNPVRVTLAFLVFTNLAMLIPSSPGGIGVFQLAAVYALSPFHVPADRAVALSLVNQGLFISVTGILGYVFVTRSHVSLASMQHQALEIDASELGEGETPPPTGTPQ